MDAQVTAALISGGAALAVAVLGIGGAITAQLFTTRHALENSLALQERQYARQERERQEQSRREDAYRFAEQRRSTYGRGSSAWRGNSLAQWRWSVQRPGFLTVSVSSPAVPIRGHMTVRYPPRLQGSCLRMRGNESGGFMANSALRARRFICSGRQRSGKRLIGYGTRRMGQRIRPTAITLPRGWHSWTQRVTNSGPRRALRP